MSDKRLTDLQRDLMQVQRQRDYFEDSLNRMTQEHAETTARWREAERQLREAQERADHEAKRADIWEGNAKLFNDEMERLEEALAECQRGE